MARLKNKEKSIISNDERSILFFVDLVRAYGRVEWCGPEGEKGCQESILTTKGKKMQLPRTSGLAG